MGLPERNHEETLIIFAFKIKKDKSNGILRKSGVQFVVDHIGF